MKHRLVLFISLVLCCLLSTSAGAVTANGTTNGWMQVNQSGFGSVDNASISALREINQHLYAGVENQEDGAQIWRMDKNDNWTSIMEGGFGEDYNVAVFDLVQFKDKIYAGTFGGEIWRSQNGNNWNRVVTGGFGHSHNKAILEFLVFKDMLYCGTGTIMDPYGGEIFRTATGDAGSWEQIANYGIDENPDNDGVFSFVEYNDHMYVSTYNEATGTEVWRTPDGNSGEQSNADGFGDPLNVSAFLEPFNGFLYAGTNYFAEGTGAGAELWRCTHCNNPGNWKKVPIQKGFGDPNNRSIVPLSGPDGMLYALVDNRVSGMQVWVSKDGVNFSQISQGGFGDSGNIYPFHNANRFYRNFLYTGTGNLTTGGQVWKRAFLTQLPLIPK